MKSSRPLAVLSSLLLLAACGDGAGPGEPVIPDALVGTWVAEPACLPNCGFTFISVANPQDTLNATAFVGVTTEIGIHASGRFTLFFMPGGGQAPTEGTAWTSGNRLMVRDGAGAVDTLEYTVGAGVLELRFLGIVDAFDFNGDGTPDPARARAVLRRR
jgi:hypothetical protein